MTEAQVRLALAYQQRFGEEVDALIGRDRRDLDELTADYRTIDFLAGLIGAAVTRRSYLRPPNRYRTSQTRPRRARC